MDFIVIDSSEYIVLDHRLALPKKPEKNWRKNSHYLTSYVRQCLKDYIGQKFLYKGILKVFLLDPEIERLFSEHENYEAGESEKTPLTERKIDLLLAAVHD